jgi:transposase
MCRGKAECGMNRKNHDVEKQRYWVRTIGDAARSGMSIREFCRQRRVKESQFYWWQRKLKELKGGRQERNKPSVQDRAASFALVSEDGMDMPAGLELVLRDGRRLRISQGVQEETLRAVLAAMESGNK